MRRRIEEAGVRSSFFICAMPRTGSTMLADVMAGAGVVGRAQEDFNHTVLPSWARVRVGDYLVDCARRAERTGVLGTKLFWYQCEGLLHLLRRLHGSRGLSDRELVECIYPHPRFIWIRREDVVAQAVSWWKARTTGVWLDRDAPQGEGVFDFEAIDQRVRMVEEQAVAWRAWFAANAIEPLPLVYEELAADPRGVARQALDFLGVDVPADLVVEPRTRRQADALNEEWIRRYRELAEAR